MTGVIAQTFDEQTLSVGTDEAIYFLERLHPDRIIHLSALSEDGIFITRSFAPGDKEEMRAWIRTQQTERNVFHSVNGLKALVRNRKAKKEDVEEAFYLQVDIDTLEGLARLEQYPLRPSVIVFSGGGYHGYWKLKAPTTDFDLVERINAEIADAVGGDSCGNIDRVLRTPGTVNLPNEKKRRAGRVPVLSKLVFEDFGLEYALGDFPMPEVVPAVGELLVTKAADIVPIELSQLPDTVSPATRALIEKGDDPERPRGTPSPRFPSRSEAVYAVCCDLARAGCDEAVIAGVLINPAFGISASILETKKPGSNALRQARRAVAVVSDGWPDTNKEGKPRATMPNAKIAALRLGLTFAFDMFRKRKTIGGHILQEYEGEISDDGITVVRNLILERFKFDPREDHVRDAVNGLCLAHQFHPIQDMLDALVWDGVPRLDRWMISYLSADDTPLNQAIGAIMLIAAVRRVRRPGVKFDTIVVFEGVQGSGKSTALKILAGPNNHSDQEILTLDAKAQMELLAGVWIYELGEVEGMNKAEVNKIKAFASRGVDRARPAYGRFLTNQPRQAIFVGTTNDDKYLRDQTGNRRFWPVKTGTIDLKALARDRDQLLAEAALREAQGEAIELPETLWQAAAVEQAARLEEDPWMEKVQSARPQEINGTLRHYTSVLLSETLGIPPERQTQGHTKRVAALMKKLGWKDKSFRIGKSYARGYEIPTPEDYHTSDYKAPLF